jgi:phosphomannomutase
MVDSVTRPHGMRVLRTGVGESIVMDRGLEEGAVLAGEGSGGVGALPLTMTFDALLTIGMILEAMASTGAGLAELVEPLPKLTLLKGEVACLPDQVYRAVESFRLAYADRRPDTSDGVRVEWEDAWLHVRASNTESLLRVIVEAETERRARNLFEDSMQRAGDTVRGSGGEEA